MDATPTKLRKNTVSMNGIASGYTTMPDDPVRVRGLVDEAVENLHRRVAYIKGEYERSLARNKTLSKSRQDILKQMTALTHQVRDLDVQLAAARDDLAVSENKVAASDAKVLAVNRKLKRAERKLKFTSNRLERERAFFARRAKSCEANMQRLERDVERAEDTAIRRRRDVDIGNLIEQVEEHLARSNGVIVECSQDNHVVLTLLTQLMKEKYKRENLEDQLFSAQDQIANYKWRELTMRNSTGRSDVGGDYDQDVDNVKNEAHQHFKIEDDDDDDKSMLE